MNISKENLIRINEGFGGSLKSDSSLDFAIEKQYEKKLGDYKKLAHIIRAILVDRPFTDGNKRTAMFVCFSFASEFHKEADKDLLVHQIQSIAEKNITNIRTIEERLKNVIK